MDPAGQKSECGRRVWVWVACPTIAVRGNTCHGLVFFMSVEEAVKALVLCNNQLLELGGQTRTLKLAFSRERLA